jgi:hypothetical protein
MHRNSRKSANEPDYRRSSPRVLPHLAMRDASRLHCRAMIAPARRLMAAVSPS